MQDGVADATAHARQRLVRWLHNRVADRTRLDAVELTVDCRRGEGGEKRDARKKASEKESTWSELESRTKTRELETHRCLSTA